MSCLSKHKESPKDRAFVIAGGFQTVGDESRR